MALPATTTGRQVYQQIEKAGDKGAWSKSLKDQTKLQQHTITKVPTVGLRMLGILSCRTLTNMSSTNSWLPGKATKELIKLQLIKEVKSVSRKITNVVWKG